MRKIYGILLTIMGLLFLTHENVSANAEESEEGISVYSESVDISQYKGTPIQIKVNGGEIQGYEYITNKGERKKVAGEHTDKRGILMDVSWVGSTTSVELEIYSETGEYSISINDTRTPETAVDVSNIKVESGNYIDTDYSVGYKEEGYIKFRAEAGKRYLYNVRTWVAFDVIDPNGEIIDTSPTKSPFNGTNALNIVKELDAGITGDYYIRLRGTYPVTFASFRMYELFDSVEDISEIKKGDTYAGREQDILKYAVEYGERGTYTYQPEKVSGEGSGVSSFTNSEYYRDGVEEDRKDFTYRSKALPITKTAENGGTKYVSNRLGGNTTFAHLHTWKVSDIGVGVNLNGKSFDVKTGDSAKEKVKELKSEDREHSLVADPIDSFAGNFVDERKLLSYSGNNPLEFKLSYDSIANESKSLGGGFTHNFETYLDIQDKGIDIYWAPNSVVKTSLEDGKYTVLNSNQKGVEVTKTELGYLVTDKNKNEYTFDEEGNLIETIDKVGVKTNYTRGSQGELESVINDKQQEFKFTYDENNKLKTVIDSSGRELQFTYNGDRLQTIILVDGKEFNITYDKTGKVSQLAQDGVIIVKNVYDTLGRVSSQRDGNNKLTTFTYDEYSNTEEVKTVITTGKMKDTKIHDKDGNLLESIDGEGYSTKYQYDDNRNIISEIDKNGNEYTYSYDSLNRLIKETNPDGTFKEYSYDNNNNITRILTEDGKEVIITYEGTRLVSVVDKEGNKVEYNYDTYGNLTQINRGSFNITNKYNEQGYLIETIQDNNSTTFVVDNLGRVTETKLADGNILKTGYDTAGNIIKTVDAEGKEILNTYNTFGDVISTQDSKGVITNYKYEGNGNLYYEEREGRVLNYVYNEINLLIQKSNGDDRFASSRKDVVDYVYNNRGDLIKETDGDKKSVSMTYDGNGNLVTRKIGTSVETYEYDNMNHLVSYKDGKGNITQYETDTNGNITTEKLADNTEIKHTYDSMGKLLSVIDGEGNETKYTYDVRGNLIKLLEANGAETSYVYNNSNQPTEVTNALGETTKYTYNKLGQLTSVLNPLDEVILEYTYDLNGNVASITNGNKETYTFKYDLNNNVTQVTDALGNIVETSEYNNFGELLTLTDALGNTETNTYNKYGQRTEEIDAKGTILQNTYSKASRLTRTTNTNTTTADYGYDAYGNISVIGQAYYSRTVYKVDENQNIISNTSKIGAVNYGYDTVNNLISKINARGNETQYEYDNNGRLVRELYDDKGIRKEYDEVGNLLSVGEGENKITREYDLLGRVISKTQDKQTIKYKYDKRGHLIELTYPNNKVIKYTYDVVGNMLSVTDWNNKETKYEYDNNGRLTKTINSNGIIENRTYDKNGRVTVLERTKDNKVIYTDNIVYDSTGNIIQENDKVFKYDTLNRLIETNNSNYTYTGFGNISEFNTNLDSEPYNQKMAYGYDNELKSINSKAVQVDKDGNLLTYTLNGIKYAADYDSQNNLLSLDSTNYTYDAEGNRIGVETEVEVGVDDKDSESEEESKLLQTNFLVDTDNQNSKYSQLLTEETDGKVKYHIYGNGLIGTYESEEDSESFLTNHYDLRGSTVSVSDTTGTEIGTIDYDEYGVVLHKSETIETRFLYNGQFGVETDSNGLNYMRNRYYNPEIKRFMNRDVITGNIEDSQTLNRYAYVNGNPISYNDPFGLARESIANSSWLSTIQTTLDVAGMIPGLGIFPDLLNASIYLSTGNYEEALWSGVGAIPIVGDATSGVRNVNKISKVINSGGKETRKIQVYDVGRYNDLKNHKRRSNNKEDIGRTEIHHMVQKHPANQVVKGYDGKKGASIVLPYAEHRSIPTHRGVYSRTDRELLAKDIWDLKKYTNAPNSAIKELVGINKRMHPEAFKK